MITKYKDFISESNIGLDFSLEDIGIKINFKGIIERTKKKGYSNAENEWQEHTYVSSYGKYNICKQNIDLENKNLDFVPKVLKQFDYVDGILNISNNRLKSLENCPKEINGNFNCAVNYITSLEGCPEKINGNFNCIYNLFTTLEYGPKYVKGNYFFGNGNNSKRKYEQIDYDISDYPLCIIDGVIGVNTHDDSSIRLDEIYEKVCVITKNNQQIFRPFIDNNDKKGFHKKLIEFDSNLIKYYTSWSPFDNKNSRLLF